MSSSRQAPLKAFNPYVKTVDGKKYEIFDEVSEERGGFSSICTIKEWANSIISALKSKTGVEQLPAEIHYEDKDGDEIVLASEEVTRKFSQRDGSQVKIKQIKWH